MSEPAEAVRSIGSGNLNPRHSSTGALNECFTPAGEVRPSWEPLISSFKRIGDQQLEERSESCRRILRDHGVSCFVQRNGVGTDVQWQLDLIPLIIDTEDWQELSAGLKQRAHLLNAILGDLYGKQRLVRDGLVPAALVYANPGYLRACQAIRVKDNNYLQIYAADVARGTDGRWWIIADRTQGPGGLGFAMENRSVLSRVLPETMREVQPRPVLDALKIQRETLRRLSAGGMDNPSIVLLTPGPRNEAYFEHAYLSRLMGLTLVEGDDLTVRDRHLFVKTLNGLRRANVVLRRVIDGYCDPLELQPDSLLGVPGLVEATRAGNLGIGNALGSGLLESPGFMPFLPGICRHLLDEELRLPSVATWWCGQAAEQHYVREHLDDLVIRPAFSLVGKAMEPTRMRAQEIKELLSEIEVQPHGLVGQEQVRLSQAPVWTGHAGDQSRPCVLRVFVMHDGVDFVVVPGGLARVMDEERMASCMLPITGLSKDVWVLSGKSEPGPESQRTCVEPLTHRGANFELPSRTADNFFWLGRYTERLEQAVRTARHTLRSLEEETSPSVQGRFKPLEQLLTTLRLIPASLSCPEDARELLEKEILLLLFQSDRAGGMRDLLKRIHLAAFSVRDRLSSDTWQILNRLGAAENQHAGSLPLVEASRILYSLVLDLAALSGMEMENMTRGNGWLFLDIGRRVERGIFIARLVEAISRSDSYAHGLLESALQIADSVMTHRRRYFSEPRLDSVLEVLALDRLNPRSLAFQIGSLKAHSPLLPSESNPEGVQRVQSMINELDGRMASLLSSVGGKSLPDSSHIAGLLAQFSLGLSALSEALTEVYFTHVSVQTS